MVKKNNKYTKFNTITPSGREEPFTGVFKSKAEADKWYNAHGRDFESRGIKLVRRYSYR
ncbi:MAG: hypothetical protein NXI00_20075 [Cytophagales bacterium]|nr:hypothetical protein [Cytophagales bacterium]